MSYYNPYQASPAMRQYMPQGQYLPAQGTPAAQGMPAAGLPVPGIQLPGMPDAAELQHYIYPANLQEALRLTAGAVAGELEDRQFYEYLIGAAPTEEEKEIIRGIRDDEIRHFGLFRLIYFQLTGQLPPSPAEIPFARPASYCSGLKKALLGEEDAVSRYRKILFALQSRVHINMLTEIITDELRHGNLYGYLYSKNGCSV